MPCSAPCVLNHCNATGSNCPSLGPLGIDDPDIFFSDQSSTDVTTGQPSPSPFQTKQPGMAPGLVEQHVPQVKYKHIYMFIHVRVIKLI